MFSVDALIGWSLRSNLPEQEPSFISSTTIVLDLAKSVFQVQGGDDSGAVVITKKSR